MAGTAIFGVALVTFPVTMYLGHSRHAKDWAARIADTMLGAIWVLFTWSIIGQILELPILGIDDPLRSRLVAGFVVIAAIVLLGWGYIEAMRVPRIRSITITIPRLHKDFTGAKLVVISDTHYGPLNRAK
ncbi:hypothetical protein LWC34_07070 [Kibdelosporangium philippinense]|uniref:Metallophosphoesterase n=1 Tax=Kibdelosporangium philippinense TaxID=211113 RepID=A0ABS8Z9S3_9PSEU|nr:hypothetical protein [Kibdelosporangium philippinense]MCE7002592.1 hypothetical protein [Kibdelosporangium philippinense]